MRHQRGDSRGMERLGTVGHLLGIPEGRWAAGFLVAAVVSAIAHRIRALDVSGAIAATAVGGTIVGAAGWWPGFVLVVFFATSSALSMFSSRTSSTLVQVRGKRRDAIQVLANGGVPALCAVAGFLVADDSPWLTALVAAVAGAAADTWATEIGRFSRSRPRMVTTWSPVAPGTSGAISALGTVGSLGGAFVISLTVAAGAGLGAFATGHSVPELVGTVTVAGVGGSLIDSLLGATIQAAYRCPACKVATEAPIHRCGTAAVPTGGIRWMTNDTVNLLATAGSASVALAWSALG